MIDGVANDEAIQQRVQVSMALVHSNAGALGLQYLSDLAEQGLATKAQTLPLQLQFRLASAAAATQPSAAPTAAASLSACSRHCSTVSCCQYAAHT